MITNNRSAKGWLISMLLIVFVVCNLFSSACAQNVSDALAAGNQLNYNDKEDYFELSALPYQLRLKVDNCKCQRRPYKYKRSKSCKATFQEVEKKLQELLRSGHYSDFGKAKIYFEMYSASRSAKRTNITYLDSSLTIYQSRIKALRLPDFDEYYSPWKEVHTSLSIYLIKEYVRQKHPRSFEEIARRYRQFYPAIPGGVFCTDGTEWIEPMRNAEIALAMYRKGYHQLAIHLISYEGIVVGNAGPTISGNHMSFRRNEYIKQTVFAHATTELTAVNTLEHQQEEALKHIYLIKRKHYSYAYCYFGNHTIMINLGSIWKELPEMSDEEIISAARNILLDSVLFSNLPSVK